MDRFVSKVTRILRKAFPPPDRVELRDEDGILGAVISNRFRGLDAVERFRMIWDILEDNLTPEQRRRIVSVLAITPREELMHTT